MGQTFSSYWYQSVWISTPTFLEKDLPDQTGKVHIVTGGYGGIGLALTKFLYAKNATIYVAGRDPQKGATIIEAMKSEFPASKGRLVFLHLDLADLTTIKKSAQEFLSKEKRLDVLVNNAGVMVPPKGSKTKQGYELQTGTNVYGPWLFTYFLLPLLEKTAKTAEEGSVRVLWAGSLAIDLTSPAAGVDFDERTGLVKETGMDQTLLYGQSKAASIYLARETARRVGGSGVVSVAFNPGNLKTDLARDSPLLKLFARLFAFDVRFGAYTELFAGWSPEISLQNNGVYVVPWGQIAECKTGVTKAVEQGAGEKLWDVCERVAQDYM